jgi:hypothetical protein
LSSILVGLRSHHLLPPLFDLPETVGGTSIGLVSSVIAALAYLLGKVLFISIHLLVFINLSSFRFILVFIIFLVLVTFLASMVLRTVTIILVILHVAIINIRSRDPLLL